MAYKFNAGLDTEFIATEMIPLSYIKRDNKSWYDSAALTETLSPFNITPFLTAFLQDQDNFYVELAHRSNNDSIGIRFTGDVNNVNITFATYNNTWHSYTDISALWNGDPQHAASPLNVYFYYCRLGTAPTTYYSLYCASESDPLFRVIVNLSIEVADWVPPTSEIYNKEVIIGQRLEEYDHKITDFNAYPSLKAIPITAIGSPYYFSDYISNHPAEMMSAEVYYSRGGASLDPTNDNPFIDWLDNNNTNPGQTDPPKPPSPFDPSTPDPYDPSYDDTSDPIEVPAPPAIGVTDTGFMNIYNPSVGALAGLGSTLFPPIQPPPDVMGAISNLCDIMISQNLINYVVDCHVIPAAPSIGQSQVIKVGYMNTNVSAPVVTSDYVLQTCGGISIQEYYGGFQDYLCTHSQLYLPFLGFVDMKPEYWQNGVLQIEYRFNVIDGSFMAYVISSSSKSQLHNTVIAQYAGNACMHIPITGVNYANMVSGIVGAAFDLVKNPTGINAASTVASALNTMAAGGKMYSSNGYNSTSCLLGVRTPYLLIERAVPSYPTRYGHDKGYPTNISTSLSGVSGYTVIEDIDLSGIPLTEGELSELRSLLNEGVYF